MQLKNIYITCYAPQEASRRCISAIQGEKSKKRAQDAEEKQSNTKKGIWTLVMIEKVELCLKGAGGQRLQGKWLSKKQWERG